MIKNPYAVLILVAFLSCCSGLVQSPQIIEQAGTNFHRQLDSGEYGQIYDSAGNRLKGRLSREEFIKLLKRVTAESGKCNESKTKLTGSFFRSDNRGGFGRSSYVRQCESSTLYEDLQWQIIGGTAQIQAYVPKRGF